MKDKEIVLEVKPRFKISYEIFRHVETIFILLILLAFVFKDAQFILPYCIILITYILWLVIYIVYVWKRYKKHSYKFYKDRICYNTFYTREKKEVLFKDIKNISYGQSFFQRFFKLGEITIRTNSFNLLKNHFTMQYIDNVADVYNQIVDIYKEK